MADATLTERYRAARSDTELAVLEGLHALKHALRFGAEVVDVRTRDARSLAELARELAPDVADSIVALAAPVPPATFDAMAPRPHPTGVVALARRPAVAASHALTAGGPAPVVLLERPTHHGNIGAVVRVAAAAGAAGVLVTGPHDPWHPSSIRGGAGLQFALPVAALDDQALAAVVESDRPLVAVDPNGDPITALRPDPRRGARDGEAAGDTARESEAGIPPGAILVFGSERQGVTDAILARAERRVSIPMRAGVSSLNLATAVAVALYATRGAGASW